MSATECIGIADTDAVGNFDLQDENEEMGRDLSEGHVHALERQLALAKAALEDMRRAYLQLEDVTQQLDNEAEDLQAQVTWLPGCCCLFIVLCLRSLAACKRGLHMDANRVQLQLPQKRKGECFSSWQPQRFGILRQQHCRLV